MDDINAAFDDAYRTNRIEAGDDPTTLPNPYSRPLLADSAPTHHAAASSSGGGGFIADDDAKSGGGGGFIVDDDTAGGGGFIVDEDEPPAGGFLPESEDDEGQPSSSSSQLPSITKPTTIPLSAIPEALANLGLDSSDPSVLSLFSETAYIPSSASRRRLPPGVKQEKVVGRQEFQQVASVLLDEQRSRATSKRTKHQDTEEEEEEGEEEEGGVGRRRPTRRAAVQGRKKAAKFIGDDATEGGGFVADGAADDSEDDFQVSRQRRKRDGNLDTGSDLTDEEEHDVDDAAARDSSSRRRRRAPPSPSPSPSLSENSERSTKRSRRSKPSNAPSIRSSSHLNPLQRENAHTLFQLLLSHLPSSTLPISQRRIGAEQLGQIIGSIGEKIPPKEIEEMLEEGSKLFAPASEDGEGGGGERKSTQAIKGMAAAQGITGSSVGVDEFAGILVHNRLL